MTELLAPPVCALCGGDGQRLDEPWGLDLCCWCEQACTPVWNPCPRCGSSVDTDHCANCQRAPPPFDATFSLFRYEDPVDLLVTSLKFRHELAGARVLGTLFARAHRRAGRELPQCLVPMPLHVSRHRERGFNQCAEIARHIAPRLRDAAGRPLAVRHDLLQRVRATAAQSELAAAERAANLRGAFRAGAGPMPRHVALLDDVMTTGHTAAAATLALKQAGCCRVEIWACARALQRGSQPDLVSSAALQMRT
ncbi:MAG: ComF family protein [Steroidobacteraceae bacterium]